MEVFAFVMVMLMAVGMVGAACYVIIRNDRAEKARKKKEQEVEQFNNMILELAYIEAQKSLEELNFDYALGLYDGDIDSIVRANAPFNELAKYIDYAPITLEDFKKETLYKANIFLKSSKLSDSEQDDIKENIAEQLKELTQELVDEIVDVYSKVISEDDHFLKGKINYTLSTLGMLQNIADETNNVVLSEHIYQIRKKRGFEE